MNNLQAIQIVVEDYFIGTFEADAERIKRTFHKDAMITGNFDNCYVEMNLSQFIERVTNAKINNKEKRYDKQIIHIDLHHDIALVKARVLVNETYFIDYIPLIKIDGQWVIRQKSFSNAI